MRFYIAEKSFLALWPLLYLRIALIVVFFWFGGMKFTGYEANGIHPFIANSPLVSWLDALFGVMGASQAIGVIELATGLALAVGAVHPLFSALGAAMSCCTYAITVSFMLSTPGVVEASLGGFPAISAGTGQFLLKDIVLFAASFVLLASSVDLKNRNDGGSVY